MSGNREEPRWLRWVARLCLRAYPRSFRTEHGAAYRETVAHRWRCERERAGQVVAGWRTLRVLVVDTISAAPRAHRRAPGQDAPAQREVSKARWAWHDNWVGDARVAIRLLARRPGYTSLVVLTLGLGIGANAVLFDALDRVVLRPLPYPDGDRLVYLVDRHAQQGFELTPGRDAVARWRDLARTVEWVETYRRHTTVWEAADHTELLNVTSVSVGLPAALGVRPVVGRIPTEADAEPPPLVMLSEAFWRRAFGGDPGVVGRTITLQGPFDDEIVTVVGVWPSEARLDPIQAPDLWRVHPSTWIGDSYFALALTAPGATLDEVEAELRGLVQDLPRAAGGLEAVVHPPHWMLGDTYGRVLWLLFGGVLVLLVVALANAANLLLNRTLSREGEVGVRVAIGGSSGALVRLFLIESGTVTALGLAVALGVSWLGTSAMVDLIPQRMPLLDGGSPDRRVLVYTALLAGLAAVLCVVVPAVWLRGLDVRNLLLRGQVMRGASVRSGWVRKAMVAVQVGLATVLAIGSAVTLRSFQSVIEVDVGVDVDELAGFSVVLPSQRYPTAEDQAEFWSRMLESVRGLPVIEAVAHASPGLLRYYRDVRPWWFEGQPAVEEETEVYTASVGLEFVRVVGVPLLEGRQFEPGDGDGVVLVNRSFAEGFGGSVVGRRLTPDDSTHLEIIGVVGDIMVGGSREEPGRLQRYTVEQQPDGSTQWFVVRTAGDPASALNAVRARLHALDPSLPLRDARTARDVVRADTAPHRFLAQLLGVFGALSLVLAIMGVYGVAALDAQRRTPEVGIRVALGARSPRVLTEVVAAGLRPVILGAAIGALISLWVVRYLEVFLYRIRATDPLSIGAAVGLLLVAATAACWLPARRACRADPVEVLRAE